MKVNEVNFIKACMPKGRTVFRYRPDAYAPYLLSKAVKGPTKLKALKQSPYASLLNRPLVKQQLSRISNGQVEAESFELTPHHSDTFFLLSLGSWGHGLDVNYAQLSREGCNLVLRLVFSNQHDLEFNNLFHRHTRHRFESSNHPVTKDRFTLAWSRLDIDLERGEVLIEEIQNDWLRRVENYKNHLIDQVQSGANEGKGDFVQSLIADTRRVFYYTEGVLQLYKKIWSEAMLAATMHFIVDELGIKKVFMHSPESGKAYKNFEPDDPLPPASIYRDLPRKFCFRKSFDRPHFLKIDERIKELEANPHFKRQKQRKRNLIEQEYAYSTLPMHRLILE